MQDAAQFPSKPEPLRKRPWGERSLVPKHKYLSGMNRLLVSYLSSNPICNDLCWQKVVGTPY